jgi:hypothetical protein
MSRLTKEEEDSAEDEDVAEDFGSALLELSALEEETSLLEDSSSLIEDEDSRMSNSSRETFKEELSLQAVNRAAPHKERSANFFMVRI